jgi:hypothetical protein
MIESHISHGIDRIWPLRCSHKMKVDTIHEWGNYFEILFHVGGVSVENHERRLREQVKGIGKGLWLQCDANRALPN